MVEARTKLNTSMHRLLFAAAFFVTCAGACLPRAQCERAAAAPRQIRPVFLEGYLLVLGERYDVYFTLETAWAEGESSNWMESYRVEGGPPGYNGIRPELERLRTWVPNLTYVFDPRNPKVVHIIDARLLKRKGYGLNGVVRNFAYEGNLRGLVDALRKRGTKVSNEGLMSIGDMRPHDFETTVHTSAQRMGVRDAITRFLPLKGRRRIVWSSTTKLAPRAVSRIDFYGPVKR